MLSIKRILPVLVLACMALLGCSSKSAYYSMVVPPEANVDEIQRIAVAEFRGLDRSGRMISAKLAEGIVDEGYFQLFERDELDRILAERDFNDSDVVDPDTVRDLKLMGVDALIFGVVDAYSIDQQTGVERIEREVGTGRYRTVERENGEGEIETIEEEITEVILIDRGYVMREGNVGVTFRLANINTGEIVALKSETARFAKRAWDDEREKLPPKDVILEDLAAEVTYRFLGRIHPRTVTRRVNFENNELPQTELGISYAQSGLWDKAYEAFSSAVRAYPNDAANHFNKSLAADVMGREREAMVSAERAIELDPQDKYMRWLAQLRLEAGEGYAR